MKIIIPGGTGQVGTILAKHFHQNGHEVIVLTRGKYKTPWKIMQWDGKSLGDWAKEINGSDVVINLAGRSINCRYTTKNRQEIMQSRVDSTRVVGEAIAKSTRPPRVWLQASAANIYAQSYGKSNDEVSGEIDTNKNTPDTWRFSVDVVKAWEAAADQFDLPQTRKVLLRTTLVMSPDRDGVFDVLSGLVRKGLGGKQGDGRQFVSWIHDVDFVRAIDWIIDHKELSGPVNMASPNPLSNNDLMHGLREVWGAKIGLPAMRWMLEIGAVFLKTETELILKSRNVIPGKLLQSGFSFQFPNWKEAAKDLRHRQNN